MFTLNFHSFQLVFFSAVYNLEMETLTMWRICETMFLSLRKILFHDRVMNVK